MKKTIISYACATLLLGSSNLAALEISKDFTVTCSPISDVKSNAKSEVFYFSAGVNTQGSQSFLTGPFVGKSQAFDEDPGKIISFTGIDYLDIDKKDVEVSCRYKTDKGKAVTLIAQFPDDMGKHISFVEYTKESQTEPMKLHYEGPALTK